MAAPAEAVVSAQTFMKIKKVKVKKGQKISKGTIYCLYTSTTDTVQRLKSNDNGVVTAIYAQEGVEVDAGLVLDCDTSNLRHRGVNKSQEEV